MRSPLALAVGTPVAAGLLLGVGAAAALLLALGVWSRAAAVVAWLYLNAIAARNPFVLDGGDAVLAALTFWSIFADLDGAWSLRRGARRATVAALPVRVLECQMALVYLAAAVAKSGPTWRSGEALYHVLQDNDFARPLGMALLARPALCALLTFATRAIEAGFVPLVLSPWRPRQTRALAAALAALMHLGIFAFMRVGMFCPAMLAGLCLFVPLRAPAAPSTQTRSFPRALALALGLVFAATAVNALAPRHTPRVIGAALHRLGLHQSWTMFAPDGAELDGYFAARASLGDGRVVDPLRLAAPKLLPSPAFAFSRWFKLRDNLAGNAQLQAVVTRWLCRRLALVDVTLEDWQRPTHAPGELPARFTLASSEHRRCDLP